MLTVVTVFIFCWLPHWVTQVSCRIISQVFFLRKYFIFLPHWVAQASFLFLKISQFNAPLTAGSLWRQPPYNNKGLIHSHTKCKEYSPHSDYCPKSCKWNLMTFPTIAKIIHNSLWETWKWICNQTLMVLGLILAGTRQKSYHTVLVIRVLIATKKDVPLGSCDVGWSLLQKNNYAITRSWWYCNLQASNRVAPWSPPFSLQTAYRWQSSKHFLPWNLTFAPSTQTLPWTHSCTRDSQTTSGRVSAR